MKHFIKTLIFIFGVQWITAQEFQIDKSYSVLIHEQATDKETSSILASLVLSENSEIVLSSFKINSGNHIEKIRVHSLQNPDLKAVDAIIRVDFFCSEPFGYTISQYIMLGVEIDPILLPPLVNIENGKSTSETVYVFPSQIFGNANNITRLEMQCKDSSKPEGISVLQNYAWNDSEFESSHQSF